MPFCHLQNSASVVKTAASFLMAQLRIQNPPRAPAHGRSAIYRPAAKAPPPKPLEHRHTLKYQYRYSDRPILAPGQAYLPRTQSSAKPVLIPPAPTQSECLPPNSKIGSTKAHRLRFRKWATTQTTQTEHANEQQPRSSVYGARYYCKP